MQLFHGDCLEIMKSIPDQSIDLILTDPPYGTTACKWDSVIPFEPMWKELKRLRNGAVVLFGTEPFSSNLRMSNIKEFKYDWVWKKQKATGHLNAKKQPMRDIELLSVFYTNQIRYFPQGLRPGYWNNGRPGHNMPCELYGKQKRPPPTTVTNYPKQCLDLKKVSTCVHPTQKPTELLEYMIKTYTLEGETILDFTMGSGSTGVACKNLNRNFIGIEKDDKYFEIAKNRIYGSS